MRVLRALAATLVASLAATPALVSAAEPVEFPAVLVGHALLAADASVMPPADAPADLMVAGKFTGPGAKRVDEIGTLPGVTFLAHKDFPRKTGYSLPMKGQSVQGFSGVRSLGGGEFVVLSDNGFGSRLNSSDSALMFHRLKIDFASGKIERTATTFLTDPMKKVPFRIANEATKERYLTGADLDIESIQPVGDRYWFGEELGPFLVETDKDGRVLAVFETLVDGKPVRSPDHPSLQPPASPIAKPQNNLGRSKGFEGMAQSKDGKFLYALLEGPIWVDGAPEKVDGKEALRIVEFSLDKRAWTGRSWKYALDMDGNAIGDFNMIDASTGLILERDNNEGDPEKACPADKPALDCFTAPAKLKRVWKVELADNGIARKIGFLDLMNIRDPKKLARQGGKDGKLTFPFVTIENVDVVDATHIVVGNDNNFPYSAGRALDRNDDNEFVLLSVPELLQAK